LGPLLYHFADSYGPDDVMIQLPLRPLKYCIFTLKLHNLSAWIHSIQDMSIELSLEDVKKVAYHYGFTMEVRVSALNLFF
jgi:carnosine N-methyltransferase